MKIESLRLKSRWDFEKQLNNVNPQKILAQMIRLNFARTVRVTPNTLARWRYSSVKFKSVLFAGRFMILILAIILKAETWMI